MISDAEAFQAFLPTLCGGEFKKQNLKTRLITVRIF